MIVVYIAPHQTRRAKALYDFEDIKNSITHGEKNYTGAISEIAVCDYYREKGYEVIHNPTKDYDMIINGVTVDVKSHTTSVVPKKHYSCLVADTSIHQNNQFYVFCRYDEEKDVVYIMGRISKKEFLEIARHANEGEKDEYGFRYSGSCRLCRFDEIHEIND